MKSKILLLTAVATVCMATVTFAQNVPSYVPTNGLVGWWPFNGNANDESGNGNDGTVNGATLASDRNGNANSAYRFNGTNISVSHNSNFAITQSGQQTVSIWAYVEGEQTTQHLIGKRPVGGQSLNWQMAFNYGANEGLTYRNVTGGNTYGIITSYHLPLTTWVNIIGRYNSGIWDLFINGDLLASVNSSTFYYDIVCPLTFGNSGEFAGFVGILDDIAIYNRALTQQEITNLYNASLPTPCTTLPANLQTGLVGYWPFCGNANDESGNGNNGTVNGATLTSDRFGNSGRAYNFNGLNNYIQTSTVGPTGNLSRTISVWYNTSQLFTMIPDPGYQNEQMTFVSYGTQASAGMFDCSINHNCEGVTLDVFNSVYTRTAITSDSVWHNLVYVFNSTTGNLNNDVNIFKDGQLISASNCLIGQSLILNTGTANPITIGAYINRQIRFFKGQLDDICIWNRALDSTEISQLYQTQSSDVSNGNIGVNVIAPQRNLHVKDVIRLEPRSTAPDNPVKGDIYFDGLLNKLRVYDGTSWQNCW